tara:strand:- start:463 stop:699 length:237 start_codon:yes stop_codon:yes gene_type:complete
MKTIKLKRMIDDKRAIVEINNKRQNVINKLRSKYRSKFLKLWTLSNTGNPSKEGWEFMNKYERVMGKLIDKQRKVIYL